MFLINLETLVETIRKDYDFGFLHIKVVDDCGHDKKLDLKDNYMKKIDKMIGDIYK